MADFGNYRQGTRDSKRKALVLLSFIFIIIVAGILVFTFYPKKDAAEVPEVSDEQLIFTSSIDAEQQDEIRKLTGYNWAVMLNTSLDEPDAIRAVPYLATLELETAIGQHELLENSERYVTSETLESLADGNELRDVMENLALLEEAYYKLGIPSGIVHAERFRHLAKRLGLYGPPKGPVYDLETRLFVQEHLGFSVNEYNKWYALIRLKYELLIADMEENKDKKSVLTVGEYLKSDLSVEGLLPK